MDQHDAPSGFVPDAYDRPGRQAKASSISPLRSRWRVPAVTASVAVVAALCLYAGSATHAPTPAATARPTSLVAHSAVNTGAAASLKGHIESAADTSGANTGVHGALNLYDGAGGGLEFWFNPTTGSLTIAVGAGAGEGGGGVLGTYNGTPPEPGTYVYATADFAAGTVATFNVQGTYSLNNGVFSGQVSGTVAGRTLVISSDGTTTFDSSVYVAEGAAGWTGAIGLQGVYNFNIYDVINYIWDAIKNFFTNEYTLTDDDDTGDDTYLYEDDSSTDDDSALTTDDSSDGSSAGDDSSDDASDDASDSGSGGGDGVDDDGSAPIEEESVILAQHADLR